MQLEQLIETQQLARKLLAEHGLTGNDDPADNWTFKFSNKKTFVGTCYYRRKIIEISKYFIESHPDDIEDTILHEIAHALAYLRHNDNCGHDYRWRRVCIEIGANPSRTTDTATYTGQFNYTVGCYNEDCPNNWQRGKHRLKQAYYGYHCKWCGGPITIHNHKTGEVTYTTTSEDWVNT